MRAAEKGGTGKSSGYNVFNTEPITAMDISTKEPSFIAVAGRKVLKILQVQKNVFSEVANLCSANKKLGLDYSMTDVRWEPAGDERLATAAGNGTILVWNVNLAKNAKQVNCGKRDIAEHRRTVNRISFHPTERDILISGSQDGTMRYFDLRKADACLTFKGKSQNASVRDVKFKPSDARYFAAAMENGEIQLWDSRKIDNYLQAFVAHVSGPVFSIDWHPEDHDCLGTAGRDKFIKVWDTQHKPTETHQIRAIAEVARIKWRPFRKYHIASCALLVDNCVSVWDIRRPYLPHAQFTQHQDAVTGIVWDHKDPNILFSCGKDSMIYQNWFVDAYRPAEHAPPVALGFSSTGDIAFARSGQLTPPEPKPKMKFNAHLTASLGAMRNQQPAKVEEVTAVTSTLSMYNFPAGSIGDLKNFKVLAKNYLLSGQPFDELCDHNAEQCSKLGLRHEAQTWNIIKVMYSCNFSELLPPSSFAKAVQNDSSSVAPAQLATETNQNSQTVDTFNDEDKEVQNILSKKDIQSDEQQDSSTSEDDITESDTFFGDKDFVFSEEQEFQFDSQDISGEMQLEDYTLANEAFEPRQNIEDRPPSLETDQERPDTPISPIDSDIASVYTQQTSFVESLLTNQGEMKNVLFPKWDCSGVVKDCLKYYANKGDIQMCVSVLLVLGDKIRPEIDEKVQEEWFKSYLDLLSCLQMWTISAEIINISNLPALTELNQTSTTVHTLCSNEKCRKPLPPDKCGWTCAKCKSLSPACSICNTTVRGLLAWCQGCGHGGHLRHIKDWFQKYRSCPTGCGHNCEYR
ncbi:GATOR complex protein WDR24-like isoform X2 [Dendronephthya gigantea]|uniref:GATOR complex protein WDR24-like isoform X2 n=1 Tax=Dendronephthya gigantea TaxID=151771 RepID=UPI00106AF35B|nr:GATOR complex protein WDR24-like isoform X2 [Dendronephthya gigantea]XP_028415751.1 GATOR complex protein WDR24-like isoform X2 [Dendronephthya gigantea]